MKMIVFALFSLFFFQAILAQNSETIRVLPGENLNKALQNHTYLYAGFIKGKVFFKNGDAPSPRLNYNILSGEVQYLDQKNDTLSIANPLELNYLTIGNDSFYYDQLYLQLIAGGPTAKLAKLPKIKFSDNQLIGAFGQPSSGGTIKAYQTYAHTGQIHSLDTNEEIILTKETIYYIGDRNKHFLIAGKKNVLKLFPKDQAKIEHYFNENHVAFTSKDDMIKLVEFLQTL